MKLVSGVGAKGTSAVSLKGRRGLGPEGAVRLADLLREAPPLFLASVNLRRNFLHSFISLGVATAKFLVLPQALHCLARSLSPSNFLPLPRSLSLARSRSRSLSLSRSFSLFLTLSLSLPLSLNF